MGSLLTRVVVIRPNPVLLYDMVLMFTLIIITLNSVSSEL